MEYLRLFLVFAQVGVCTFGGGYAMLPILQREIVEKRNWCTAEELADYFAIGQCTPWLISPLWLLPVPLSWAISVTPTALPNPFAEPPDLAQYRLFGAAPLPGLGGYAFFSLDPSTCRSFRLTRSL